LCQIGTDAHLNGLVIQGTSGSSISCSVVDLNPFEINNAAVAGSSASAATFTNGVWISPHIPLIASAFDRYRTVSCGIIYEPQATTAVADRLVCAWTDDPFHPALSAAAAAAAGKLTMSQLTLLITKDSVAFAPWRPWSMKLPVSHEPKYLFDQFQAAGAVTGGRFFNFGSLSCVSIDTTPATYGVLYMDLTIDFFDPVPIANAGVIITLLHPRKSLSLRRNIGEEGVDSKSESKILPSLAGVEPPKLRRVFEPEYELTSFADVDQADRSRSVSSTPPPSLSSSPIPSGMRGPSTSVSTSSSKASPVPLTKH
jgi:hypothetical protein